MSIKRINRKWFTAIITIIAIFCLYAIHYNIYLCGDDFMYGTFSNGNILENVFGYYLTGNGRWFINILDSVLLSFDRNLFVFLNPLMIILFSWLLAKVIEKLTNTSSCLILYEISLLLVCSTHILMSREVFFWITGMMNYLFPAILFLGAYYLYLSNKQKLAASISLPKTNKIVFVILCLMAGASVEQFGLMFSGLLFLDLAYRLINKEKVFSIEYIGFIFSFIGLISILVAPGNFVRVNVAIQSNQTLIMKIIDLIYDNYYSEPALFIILCLSTFIAVISYNKNGKRKINIELITLINLVLTVLRTLIPALANSGYYILINFIFFSASMLIFFINIFKEKRNFDFVLLLFIGIGSQIMLLISEVWGFRICFSMYMIYYLFILYACTKVGSSKSLSILIGSLLSWINPYFIFIFILFLIFKYLKLNTKFIHSILYVSLLVYFLFNIYLGYKDNAIIHIENIKQANSLKEVIEIKSFENELYGWTNPPLSDFHENFFKQYYNINQNTQVRYLDKNKR